MWSEAVRSERYSLIMHFFTFRLIFYMTVDVRWNAMHTTQTDGQNQTCTFVRKITFIIHFKHNAKEGFVSFCLMRDGKRKKMWATWWFSYSASAKIHNGNFELSHLYGTFISLFSHFVPLLFIYARFSCFPNKITCVMKLYIYIQDETRKKRNWVLFSFCIIAKLLVLLLRVPYFRYFTQFAECMHSVSHSHLVEM